MATLPSCAIELRATIIFERCAIQVGDVQFMVEIARTAAQLQRGLMGRDSLNNGEGMLFVFPRPQMVSFWMKDTYIPLTVGYFDASGRLVELHDLTPRSLRSVPSSQPIRYALELGRGEFQRHHIERGDQLAINCPLALGAPALETLALGSPASADPRQRAPVWAFHSHLVAH